MVVWCFHPEGQTESLPGEGSASRLCLCGGERRALCLFLRLGTAFTIVLRNNCQSKCQHMHLHLVFNPLKKESFPSFQQPTLQSYAPSDCGQEAKSGLSQGTRP